MPDIYLLSQHPEAIPYLIEIGEEALKQTGSKIHSIACRPDFDGEIMRLPRPDAIIVHWHHDPSGSLGLHGTTGIFDFLRPYRHGAPIISFSTAYYSEDQAKREGAHAFVQVNLRYLQDDSRYISGNAALFAERLKIILFDQFKLKPAPSSEVRRYKRLTERAQVPNLYKDYEGFTPPEVSMSKNRQPQKTNHAISKSVSTMAPSSAGALRRRPRGGRHAPNPLAALTRKIEKRRIDPQTAFNETAIALAEMTSAALERDEAGRTIGTRSFNGSRCEP